MSIFITTEVVKPELVKDFNATLISRLFSSFSSTFYLTCDLVNSSAFIKMEELGNAFNNDDNVDDASITSS